MITYLLPHNGLSMGSQKEKVLSSEPIEAILTNALGNSAKIGGLKVDSGRSTGNG